MFTAGCSWIRRRLVCCLHMQIQSFEITLIADKSASLKCLLVGWPFYARIFAAWKWRQWKVLNFFHATRMLVTDSARLQNPSSPYRKTFADTAIRGDESWFLTLLKGRKSQVASISTFFPRCSGSKKGVFPTVKKGWKDPFCRRRRKRQRQENGLDILQFGQRSVRGNT